MKSGKYKVISDKLKGHEVQINNPEKAFKNPYFDFDFFDENGQMNRARAKLESAEEQTITVLAYRKFTQDSIDFDRHKTRTIKEEIETLQLMKNEVNKEMLFQDEARRRSAKLFADFDRMSAQMEKIFHMNKE